MTGLMERIGHWLATHPVGEVHLARDKQERVDAIEYRVISLERRMERVETGHWGNERPERHGRRTGESG